jgi:2'-5' RNA ligase
LRSEIGPAQRLFFAVWPPREAAAALHRWAGEARRSSGGRVMRLETIHLTLAFLGDVEEGRLRELKALELTGSRHLLPIELARYWAHNGIVWVGPEETPGPLLALANALNRELQARQFRSEAREFAAHVTLIRKAHAPDALPALPSVRWPIEECVLVESRPAGAGRNYEVLARYPLS